MYIYLLCVCVCVCVLQAVQLLRRGGVLVYSTCTVTLAENEEQVAWALLTYPCLSLVPQVHTHTHTSTHLVPGALGRRKRHTHSLTHSLTSTYLVPQVYYKPTRRYTHLNIYTHLPTLGH